VLWENEALVRDVEEVSSYPGRFNVTCGIIKSFETQHYHIIDACRELGVPYRVIDISGPDWIEKIRKAECDVFLVWPVCFCTVWKQFYDERLRVIVEDLGRKLYPTYDELWMYESKRRMHYWLKSRGVPHPRTWVFYVRDEALEFARTAPLPIVVKTDLGAGATGVRIHRSRDSLIRDIRRTFRRGAVIRAGDPRDRQWGNILFQEYIPDAREWRMIRIGDAYFGYEKLKKGEFHSGTYLWRSSLPPSDLLDFVRDLTEKAHFTSMDLDILVSTDGRFYVNELQCVFSLSHEACVVNGEPGRMVYVPDSRSWRFEAGSFSRNYLWNKRVKYVLRSLGAKPIGSDQSAER
jgi:hypothetical protein